MFISSLSALSFIHRLYTVYIVYIQYIDDELILFPLLLIFLSKEKAEKVGIDSFCLSVKVFEGGKGEEKRIFPLLTDVSFEIYFQQTNVIDLNARFTFIYDREY